MLGKLKTGDVRIQCRSVRQHYSTSPNLAHDMTTTYPGRVALHHCTTTEVAVLLVEHKPESVKIADKHGLLPSHYAAMRNILPMLSVLVQHPGAGGGDSQGMQPLHYAVIHVRSLPLKRFPTHCTFTSFAQLSWMQAFCPTGMVRKRKS
jgi:hypothetical protein